MRSPPKAAHNGSARIHNQTMLKTTSNKGDNRQVYSNRDNVAQRKQLLQVDACPSLLLFRTNERGVALATMRGTRRVLAIKTEIAKRAEIVLRRRSTQRH